MTAIRNLKQGLRNLSYWLPVIWQWRWWDYSSLLAVMVHAMKDMERGHRELGVATNSHKTARDIQIARRALELIEYDGHEHLELVDDAEGLLGKRLVLKSTSPVGTLKHQFEYEEIVKREALALFFKKFKNVRRWWD